MLPEIVLFELLCDRVGGFEGKDPRTTKQLK